MKSITLIVAAILLSQAGCSMCCGPFDYDYPTFGGKHLRADRSHGRVGSILSDPMTTVNGPSADSNLTAPPELNPQSDDEDLFGDDTLEEDSKSPQLEGIEPLRDSDTLKSPNTSEGSDSTALHRWRPRSLR